jgi:hypothetical protein
VIGVIGKAVVGLLAILGVFLICMWIMAWYFLDPCEEQLLARAVSPDASRAAVHYRKRCEGGRPDEYFFKIGRPGLGAEVAASLVSLRVNVVRQEMSALSMQPLRIWWISNEKLHIETPSHDSIKLPSDLDGVQIIAQPYQ